MSSYKNAGQPLDQFDTTQLVRLIRQALEDNPQQVLSYLRVDTLEALQITVADIVKFTKDRNWREVGTVGNPAFSGTWAHYGSPYYAAGFWKDPLGFIHLRGMIKSGTVNTAAFTLPPGYRPTAQVTMATDSNNAHGRVDVSTGGVVTPVTGNNAWFSLDNLRFK